MSICAEDGTRTSFSDIMASCKHRDLEIIGRILGPSDQVILEDASKSKAHRCCCEGDDAKVVAHALVRLLKKVVVSSNDEPVEFCGRNHLSEVAFLRLPMLFGRYGYNMEVLSGVGCLVSQWMSSVFCLGDPAKTSLAPDWWVLALVPYSPFERVVYMYLLRQHVVSMQDAIRVYDIRVQHIEDISEELTDEQRKKHEWCLDHSCFNCNSISEHSTGCFALRKNKDKTKSKVFFCDRKCRKMTMRSYCHCCNEFIRDDIGQCVATLREDKGKLRFCNKACQRVYRKGRLYPRNKN